MAQASKKAGKPAGSPKSRKKTETVAAGAATKKPHRREVRGTVVSDKQEKTIVVRVDRKVRDPLYKKFVSRSKKFQAHDEKNVAKEGDLVELVESRPLSKKKRWALKSVLRTAG